ncbi:MAG TPA: beta-propeller fold lactonase family protein [Solirubrobacterales bacterium]|nr:beta-propeller fold lactonase family protein [Solirubrobacterales bacterium]
MDDAVSRYRSASEAGDIAGVMEALAPDVEVVSPISGRMVFRGQDDVRHLLGAVYGTLRDVRWTEAVGDGIHRVLVGEMKIGPVRMTDAMVFELAPDGRIRRISPHLRPWLALTLFALVLGPKVSLRPGAVFRALRGVAPVLLALAAMAILSSSAAAAPRAGVTLLGCVTGETPVAKKHGCSTVPGTEGLADDAGLKTVVALAGGGSGPSLYAIGNMNSAVTQLGASRSGKLTFGACFTGDSFIDHSCQAVPGAYANSDQAPIAEPTAAAVSPDGRSLYVVSGNFHGSVVARFSRDPLTGALTYVDCLTGDTDPGPSGVLSCALIPGATKDGYGSGLNEASGIAISRDGRHVYVTTNVDESLTTFDRAPTTGALTWAGCVSSNERAHRCRQVSAPRHVLEGLVSPLLSPDGRFLYAASNRTGTIETFKVGAGGLPAFVDCLGGGKFQKGCRQGPGPVRALQAPTGLAMTGDGRFVYAADDYGSIVVLSRSKASGALKPVSCLSDKRSQARVCTLTPDPVKGYRASTLTGARIPLLSADGRRLLVPVRSQDAIVELRRDRHTGALSFLSCATGNLKVARSGPCRPIPGATKTGFASGFYKMTALVPGPQGTIYAAGAADATVWTLRP